MRQGFHERTPFSGRSPDSARGSGNEGRGAKNPSWFVSLFQREMTRIR
ncbi:Hypothetical protein AA314_02645 [Archangium gephyra]|uniref:Uncharacterized protein n=1 Tax=Archangium gephyra TaxID=48 RepID=A0AAC8Q4U7_9BACT|nr:Hypothetical protein AA314_02645 [Archangium gephyra]